MTMYCIRDHKAVPKIHIHKILLNYGKQSVSRLVSKSCTLSLFAKLLGGVNAQALACTHAQEINQTRDRAYQVTLKLSLHNTTSSITIV